jgi:peroxiredoxin
VALGRAYLEHKSATLAVDAFNKALELTRNDLFALAGLVEAHHALGNRKEAEDALGRMLYLVNGGDRGLKLVERVQATGVKAKPRDISPGSQRDYKTISLERFGPAAWEPYAAPELSVVDHEGKAVSLADYKDKNVILVFYLGRECLHCMKQLGDLNKQDWSNSDTVVLAVSSNKPEDNARNLKSINLPGVRILSDTNFANARRFRSYDDFEEMELHSTILIDKKGRVHWARTGGEPFGDMAFLKKQLERIQKSVPETVTTAGGGR